MILMKGRRVDARASTAHACLRQTYLLHEQSHFPAHPAPRDMFAIYLFPEITRKDFHRGKMPGTPMKLGSV
jgi:hypothetical protein